MNIEKFMEFDSDFWKSFDFSNGKIEYMETVIDEDMLLVEYPERLLLDVGFYGDGIFIARIIADHNWGLPVAVFSCKTVDNLKEIINMALHQISIYAEQSPFSDKQWDTFEFDLN